MAGARPKYLYKYTQGRNGVLEVLPRSSVMHPPHSWQFIPPLQSVLLVDLSTGIITHAYFRKNEPYNILSGLAQLAIFSVVPIAMAVRSLPGQSPWVVVPLHLTLFVSFLLTSIVFYRVSPLHPLWKYPGPTALKISKIWGAWLAYKGKLHLHYHELHENHGPIVRIGPNELSIIDVDLLPNILGSNGMPKGPRWGGGDTLARKQKENMDLISVRDYKRHAQLRKPWSRSFSPDALQDYKESLIIRGNELIECLNKLCYDSKDMLGHADIKVYISRWSFDFMGDMAFGEDFGLMSTNDQDGLIDQMNNTHCFPTIAQMIPWATELISYVPIIKTANGFLSFAVKQATKRLSKDTKQKDLFYHLASNLNADADKPPPSLIMSNVFLAIVAGSDTTASVLSGIMYYLIQHPDYFQRLRKELDTAFPPSENNTIELERLASMELLNAVINEVLRLQPPVSTSLQRAPSRNSGGKFLGDMFICEGTAVSVPPYVMHRDPRYFSPKPNEFWPERWFTESAEITTNRSAFIPFSIGPANCAGKPLAILELRYITALLVCNFDFWFEDGYDPSDWTRDILDHFVTVLGGLPVKYKRRNI